MRVELAYGRHGTVVEVPDSGEVILPVDEPALTDETASITAALRQPWAGRPLGELAAGAARVAVVFPDLTRPMPNRTVLPPLLAELARGGVPDERITLLCATGTHRQASLAEMQELSGPRSSGATEWSTTMRRARRTSPWARWMGRRCCCSASTSRPTCAL